ncbi:hypothetical protein lerEdw1_011353 [Lerista edwardsae]|nr:hypothetical protein lerEdw1_011353 [Lerista edwardsae]
MNGHIAETEPQAIELPELHRENVRDLTEPLNPTTINSDQEKANLTSCSEIVFWKCKLWMVITSMFILLIIVIILSLTFHSVIYIDEDEHWDPELIANGHRHNFSGIIKIHCANPNQQQLSESASNLFSEHLSKMLTDVYSDSPALGQYFLSAEVIPIRGTLEENIDVP